MTTSLLTKIDSPADLKALPVQELAPLADQLRREIVRATAANGGHLATNLGNVELSIALHYVLDSPHDKIIWDVGNQCYTHKILTGRRDQFPGIRKAGGPSGFVNRRESRHDHMTAGHAGTALSTALGIASARDLLGQDYRVVAVVGDGGMSAGLSFEGLNNLGTFRSQLLLILNDNNFSISPSRGALSESLRRAQARILDGAVFEQLGIQYLGPVDGHDLPVLIEILREAQQIKRPTVLHLVTRKGRGYPPSEEDPTRYHAVSPFDVETGQPLAASDAPSYAEVFGHELVQLAAKDKRVVAITAAMPDGTGLAEFARRFPTRFFDVGIAEQHAVTFAAGLAVAGARPVVAIYSTFLQRAYDQIIHDVCLQDLPVTFVLDRAGLVGADGPTHHGVFDLGYLRAIPRMVVMAPKDQAEFRQMLRMAIACGRPAAVRTPRGAAPALCDAPAETAVEIGRGELLREGHDVALVAIGSMVQSALETARTLESRGIGARVVNARFVKPLDAALILQSARQVKRLFVLEEHVRHGGFGSAVLELLAEHQVCTPVTSLTLPDDFIEHGPTEQLLDRCGLSTEKIVSRVLAEIEAGPTPRPVELPTRDPARLRAAIDRVRQRTLPTELDYWVQEYGKVGHRPPFLWNWCLEGVTLTTLPCVDPELRESVCTTKLLGVMLDVLLDDVADQSGPGDYLEQSLKIPFAACRPDFSGFSPQQQAYADTVARVWETIVARAGAYPHYDEFRELWRFDYLQLLNAMRYSHLINRDPRLLNLVEHDLYLPHNMHMMISSTVDLMCSSGFERAELGRVREAVWNAQCMGRIGNLITTWERELGDRDFTSGVYAFAVRAGLLTPQELIDGDQETLRQTIASHDCEGYFLDRWRFHHDQMVALAPSIRSVDINKLVTGLERLVELHLGSRGLK